MMMHVAIKGGPWRRLAAIAVVAAGLTLGSPVGHAQDLDGRPNRASPEALIRLGELYRAGDLVPRDPEAAFGYYSQAADLGSESARIVSARMIVIGEGVDRDVEAGLGILRDLAAAGSGAAAMVLGDILVGGEAGVVDAEAAVEAYELAGNNGRPSGWLRVGEIYRYGVLLPRDPGRSLAAYRRAALAGDSSARLLLGRAIADGAFGDLAKPEEGLAMLQEAGEAGVAGAATSRLVAELDAGTADPAMVLEALDALADAGDMVAARRLIEINRDGRRIGDRQLVPRNLPRARAIVLAMGDRLVKQDRDVETFLLDVAEAVPARWPDLYSRLIEMPSRERRSIVRKAAEIDPKTYLYLLQVRFAERGLYTMKADGIIGKGTLGAFDAHCKAVNAGALCDDGPLSVPGIQIAMLAF